MTVRASLFDRFEKTEGLEILDGARVRGKDYGHFAAYQLERANDTPERLSGRRHSRGGGA